MSESNVDTVRRMYDAFGARDADVMQELFAADVEVSQASELPWGGEYRGHDGAFTFLLKLTEHIDSQVAIESLFAAGDRVVQTGRTRGTVRANGAPFDVAEVHLWQLRDGQVVRFEAYIDTPAMLEALES